MKVIIILSLEHKMVPQTKVTLKEQSITFLLLFFFFFLCTKERPKYSLELSLLEYPQI